jgi:dihydrofolate synthase/folylpolyglutamate synthase
VAERTLDEWLAFAEATHPREIEMGLERTRTVAERLGVLRGPWQHAYIVAGTNGKGSACVALEALLLASGQTVGTTLSPHVHRFNERVRIDGEEADDELLCSAFARVDEARGEVPLTYFEFAALVALECFRRLAVDSVILEVGLGGRLDAFNVIDADTAIVTSIGLDHQAFLGNDVETIGREKAGVFRAGQTVVLGAVSDSVRRAARALHCHTLEAGRDFLVTESACEWNYESSDLQLQGLPRGALAPANCALAIAAFAKQAPDRALVAAALESAWLPGRLEAATIDGTPVLIDVAHNPAGAGFLRDQLATRHPGRRFVAVLGMLNDKDPAGVVEALGAAVTRWITIPTSGSRGQSAEALAARLPPGTDASTASSMQAALTDARSCPAEADGILVFGSFSAVEQARLTLAPPTPTRHRHG